MAASSSGAIASLFTNASVQPWLEAEQLDSAKACLVYGGSASPLERPVPSEHTPSGSTKALHPLRESQPQWSTPLQQVLDQPPSRLPFQFALLGILFCGAFGTWAWLGKIQDISRAQGRLVPQGEVYKVQTVTQGEVTQIAVKEGQRVNAGQVIAVLDNRLAEAEVNRLEQSLAMYRLQLTQSQRLTERARSEAKTRQMASAAEIRAQKAAIAQAQANTATQQQLLTQISAQTADYSQRVDRLRPLVEEGVLAQEQLFEAEQAVKDRQQLSTQTQGELQQSVSQIEQLQAELAQRQAEAAQSDLELLQQVQRLELETAQMQAKVSETETLLKAAQTRLAQLYLYAPTSGTISALNVRNLGEVTQPGATFAEIAPDGMPLILAATLSTQEAGFVKAGMPVQIKFDAFPYQTYGIIPGRVVAISPDTVRNDQQEMVYRVEIALDKTALPATAEPIEFKAGQTARAEIVTRQRRIMDVLLDPIKKIQTGGLAL